MTDDSRDPQEIRSARTVVRRRYGAALEEKSSDAFCLAVYRSRPVAAVGFALEAMELGVPVAGAAVPSVVVEFAPEQAEPPRPVRDAPAWSAVAEAVRGTDGADLPPTTTILRQAFVQRTRTARYQAMSPVYDEIERLSGTALGPGREVVGAAHIPTPVTQVCWLNRTLRTWAGPEVLADASADPSVTALDVPRRLAADADTLNHRTIGLPAFLQESALTGAGVTVAVIDSEVALRHPALDGRVVHRRNYTVEPWGAPDSHGTAVAGIVAADDAQNGGVAPAATIYNYKVLATSSLLNSDDFGGALAIQQALEDGAAIANCSWGAGLVSVDGRKSREAVAVDNAWALGMTVVKSAGNRGRGDAVMTTPADADGVVVVGATDLAGTRVEPYSSRGPAGGRPGPHVVAPGGGDAGNLVCCVVSGGFGNSGAGTSFAAPHVAGLLALWLQGDPALDPDDLRDRLIAVARPVPAEPVDAQGHGLTQAGPPMVVSAGAGVIGTQ